LASASRRAGLIAAAAIVATVTACSSTVSPSSGSPAASLETSLVVYSGRSEELVRPLVERFEADTGIEVEVRYAGTSELAATLLEEGAASPADVFFAQDAGALGAVAKEGLFATLPSATLDRVPDTYRSPVGEWVGVSGRARVVIFDPRQVDEADLPATIDGYTDPAWSGRIGWAPTNGSFQSFVTALRIIEGEEAARSWLEGIAANGPRVFEGNLPIVEAVAAGEIAVGFVNHYYLMGQLAEQGEDYPARNHFSGGGEPGALVNVAGVGILGTAEHPAAAQAFVDYLLATGGQTYFAEETFEYPLVDGVAADPALPTLDELDPPAIDLSDLDDLEGTLTLLQEVGVL
jgi:iron(III) transport system substrate-binding protein